MEKLTARQAAAVAKLSETWIRRIIREGKLKASETPCGRSPTGVAYEIDPADLDSYLEQSRAAKPGHMLVAAPKSSSSKPAETAPLVAEVVTPADVKRTIVDAPPPRFQTVDIPTNRPPCTSRAGSEDFRKYQRPGRF